jgi:hypothetical protein
MKWNTEKAVKHSSLIAETILWGYSKGYYLVIDWSKRSTCNQVEIYGYDRPTWHKFCRATDFTLFIIENDKLTWIDEGEHEIWNEIADYWESLDKDNRSGRNWQDIRHCETN